MTNHMYLKKYVCLNQIIRSLELTYNRTYNNSLYKIQNPTIRKTTTASIAIQKVTRNIPWNLELNSTIENKI